MHRHSHRAVIGAVLLFAACAVSAAQSGSLFNDALVAQGKNFEVRRGQLDDAFISYKANLAGRGVTIPEDKRAQEEAKLLDRLIITQVLLGKATAADKAKAQEKVTKFMEESRKAAGSDEAFMRQLKVLGMTPTQFTNRIIEQSIAEELVQREIRSKITIPPERVKEFYETNDAAFRQPETARASHILVATRDLNTRLELPAEQKQAKRQKAETILARAKKGEDFAKLAEEVSEDPSVRDNKGEYKFTRAKDDPRRAMVPEFEAAAFGLLPGKISDLVTTEYGYHIIKLHEITPARKTPLTEVTDKIRELLLNQETEKQLPGYFKKLKEEAGVKILDPKLAEALAELEKQAGR